jgi:hypothetical protein
VSTSLSVSLVHFSYCNTARCYHSQLVYWYVSCFTGNSRCLTVFCAVDCDLRCSVLGRERARVPSAEGVRGWISELAHPLGGTHLLRFSFIF